MYIFRVQPKKERTITGWKTPLFKPGMSWVPQNPLRKRQKERTKKITEETESEVWSLWTNTGENKPRCRGRINGDTSSSSINRHNMLDEFAGVIKCNGAFDISTSQTHKKWGLNQVIGFHLRTKLN